MSNCIHCCEGKQRSLDFQNIAKATPLRTAFSRTTDDLGRPQRSQLFHAELENILRGYSRSKRTLVGANLIKRRSEQKRVQPSLRIPHTNKQKILENLEVASK